MSLFTRNFDPYNFVEDLSEFEGELSEKLKQEVADEVYDIDWNNESLSQFTVDSQMILIVEQGGIHAYYCPRDEVICFDDKSDEVFRANLDIDISSGNAALYDNPQAETIRILKGVIESIERNGFDQGSLLDLNENKVGSYYFDLRKFSD